MSRVNCDFKALVRELTEAGWVQQPCRGGSHVQFKHPENPNVVTLQLGKKELARGLVCKMRRVAGLGCGGHS